MTEAVSPVRIVIADTHAVVRAGLRAYLHERTAVRVVGETGTAADAIPLVLERNADVLLIDVAMPDAVTVLTGLESTRVKTIALVDAGDRQALSRALDLIDGLVLKQSHLDRVFQAIELVTTGQHSIRRERARDRHGKAIPPATKDRRGRPSSRRGPGRGTPSDD
jgi:DNA-binding NarL/FixJ family response regulator